MKRRGKMGDVYAEATFHGPKAKRTLRLLVDTGSTYTWIPARVARSLGIAPADRVLFELADGRTVGRTVGEMEVEVLGRRATRRVVLGRKGDSSVIGVDTLQGLLLEVDPSRHRLRPGRRALALSPRAVRYLDRIPQSPAT